MYANELRHHHPKCGDTWHLDEVVLTLRGRSTLCGEPPINMAAYWTSWFRADATSTLRSGFSRRKLLKGLEYVPCMTITDKLAAMGRRNATSYLGWNIGSTNDESIRAENSHHPTRLRERKMRRFKSAGHAQCFLSAFGPISTHFQPRRHRSSAGE